MAIEKVEVPLYDSDGQDLYNTLIVRTFAGRTVLKINAVSVECYFEDLKRAWEAVKK